MNDLMLDLSHWTAWGEKKPRIGQPIVTISYHGLISLVSRHEQGYLRYDSGEACPLTPMFWRSRKNAKVKP